MTPATPGSLAPASRIRQEDARGGPGMNPFVRRM